MRDKPILSVRALSARCDMYSICVGGIVPATTIELVISLVVHLDGAQAVMQERGLVSGLK